MKIIVTGGAGFIGSALTRYLLEHTAFHIVVIDKLTYAASLEALSSVADDPRFSLIHLDICDASAISDAIRQVAPDLIIHLAAESHVDRSITGPRDFLNTNVIGTYNLLEGAREYWQSLKGRSKDTFRFLHVSTDEVYGSLKKDGLFRETTPYDPSSPYASSKAASDHLVLAWHRTYGLPTLISNCSNNYGPYQFPEKLIPLMIINAINEKSLPIYGNGTNVRDWLYVEDHARALVLIATEGRVGEKYNVGGNNERTNLQVVESICDIIDRITDSSTPSRDRITFVQDRPGHDFRYAIDAQKLSVELGWAPIDNFESGLTKTVHWYIENRDWWTTIQERIYRGERLGLTEDELT